MEQPAAQTANGKPRFGKTESHCSLLSLATPSTRQETKLGTAIMGPRRPKHPGRATICCSKSILLLQFPNLQIFPTRPSSILPCQFQHRSPACLPPNIHQAQFAIRDIATLTAAQAHRRRNRSHFRAHPRRRLRSTATARLQLPLPACCSACAER